MAAALTIAVLFTFSFVVVRIAAVAMRLTGLPEKVARFQCVSALTGAGFTTSESEMIVNYPVRRRLIVILMVLGNLGLVSTASTLIVSFVGGEQTASAVMTQALLFIGAIVICLAVMLNKTVDRMLCALVGYVLLKTTSLGQRRFQRLLQLDNGYSVADHSISREGPVEIGELPFVFSKLMLLGIHRDGAFRSGPFTGSEPILPGDILTCYGSDALHDEFEDAL